MIILVIIANKQHDGANTIQNESSKLTQAISNMT